MAEYEILQKLDNVQQKLNNVETEQSRIKSVVDGIKSEVGGLGIGSVLVFSLVFSGIAGYQAGEGQLPDEHDQWSVVNKDARTVNETVSKHYSGETFDVRLTKLSRTWDLNANRVCEYETREGIHYILPHYQYTESCRAITESDKPSVDRANQTLALSK